MSKPHQSSLSRLSASVHSQGPLSVEALPHALRLALAQITGLDLRDVRVHYDSEIPRQWGANACAQGGRIFLAPGAEPALAHEAWHIVQQRQGRVRQLHESCLLNVDPELEREADRMGSAVNTLAKAIGCSADDGIRAFSPPSLGALRLRDAPPDVVQLHRGTGIGSILWGAFDQLVHGLASYVSSGYNRIRASIPIIDLTDILSHAGGATGALVVASYVPVTIPITITYVIGGITYGVTFNLTGIILDFISVGEAPGPSAAALGLIRSGAYGASAAVLPGLACGTRIQPIVLLVDAVVTYTHTVPRLWREQRRQVRSRGIEWMPHELDQQVLALGLDAPRRGLSFRNWARDHGAFTWRYFSFRFTDWEQTFRQVVRQADLVYVNTAGYQEGGTSGDLARPTLADIRANTGFYLETERVRIGRRVYVRPRHGFTNYELAFIAEALGSGEDIQVVFWRGDQRSRMV